MIETTSVLSSKRQLTLPAQMARELGLVAGSRVILRLEDDRIARSSKRCSTSQREAL